MRALVLAAGLLAGCSRCGGAQSPSRAPDAAPPEDARIAEPDVEASAPVEITLEKAPAVEIRAVGPSLVEVMLGDGGPATWKPIEIERHVAAEGQRQTDRLDQTLKRRIHSAKPGTTYAYRARSAGAWSPEVTVQTAEPRAAPPIPISLTAKATTPFAVQLSWEADARMAAGFEIEVSEGLQAYVRAALVDATARQLVHHHLVPNRSYSYRVRAFNGRGVSARRGAEPVTTPEHGSAETRALPPCTRLPAAIPDPPSNTPQQVVAAPGAHPLYNVPAASSSLGRRLFGEYEGCFRELGAFDLQDGHLEEVDGRLDEGFPLVRAIAGAGEYAGAEIYTLRFSRGRYTVADVADFCGEPWPDPDRADPKVGVEGADDVTAYAPPFAACQRDFPR